jgi:hypothetical protein
MVTFKAQDTLTDQAEPFIDVNVMCDDDTVTFVDIGKERTVSILIPHSNASSFQSIVSRQALNL